VNDNGHSFIRDFEIGIDEIMIIGICPVTTSFMEQIHLSLKEK
tara:strand:+ start:1673 stop:1801 length:129 start_codon:yes stop_codon:yes gene_type:complete